MKSIDHPGRAFAARLGREALGTLLPAALAVGLFLLAPGDSRSQTDPSRRPPKGEDAVLCDGWHRGSGDTVPLDLARVKRAYLDLKTRLTRTLDSRDATFQADLRRHYDAGLPACTGDGDRMVALPAEKGMRLKGRAFYFASVGDPSRLEFPKDVDKDPSVQVLIMRTRSLGDLPEIAKRLGRPVTLVGAEFAKSLGVRCANTLVQFSEKGDELHLHESR